ncbi:DMT family transporter [Tuwongella immobilis]|uniref:Uncharacterized protein n=1 Tax=Tuwongella immobilis TaxID=692036 RepID=A0A6C2YSG8_9BACT|nr:multidrug efflux SMR transporter [Tuwongella immobilis]VIP04083.1 membrane protein : Cation/cationic drug transporter OS=Thiocystis violascens (strain ATCC 17096 / DSM 198 / 6111) GN=Thivi_0313 PE=3 SV=1: Multi_Drug_Res [Tuwongella immobilis]VTS05533.1 membrane protein : Cation/cationic drug transporter OS=Thiocystis violascens (strain ATCC 17096 / DSM 198 / 6111) GN=Thivi_0313 PE=3 SV=1: Multi_Drug_Res [Tuwongella immobilis]
MSLILLLIAIVCEVFATTNLKLSQGFTRVGPSILMGVGYAASFACMGLAMRTLEIGFAYAVWSGVGTALIATVGILYFREPATTLKILSIVLIILGVIGLKVATATSTDADTPPPTATEAALSEPMPGNGREMES